MPESIGMKTENKEAEPEWKQEITPELLERLSPEEEPGRFYRGVPVEDAIKALLGKLNLESEKDRDNATINMDEAIYFARTSQTKDGKKFLCAMGFNPAPGADVKNSYLGRWTFFRVRGPVVPTEFFIRFAGKEPGKPSKKVKFFSPKEFCDWCQKNL
jgi:hypothetical protein